MSVTTCLAQCTSPVITMWRISRFQAVARVACGKMNAFPVAVRALCVPAGEQSEAEAQVKVAVKNRVATITLNRPKQLNALTVDMGTEFRAVVEDLKVNCDEIGAVVVTGEGRAFSAGGDLKYLLDRHHDSPTRNSVLMRRFYERFLCLRELPMPVIAAINGPAIGAGLCMAMGCDIRLAATSAKMGVTFVRLGLHPGMGATHFMPAIVGPQAAARMLLTGDVVDGTEAQEMGLVLKAVPGEELMDETYKLAESIASAGPEAVRSCVRSLRMKQDEGLDKALWREADTQAHHYGSEDLYEGVMATKEKRSPTFSEYTDFKYDVPTCMAQSDRFNVNISFSKNWEHLQNKYVGTGHPDMAKYEWVTNHHRDTLASHLGHPDMVAFCAIAENESVGRVRFNMLEKMLQPCGKPPAKD